MQYTSFSRPRNTVSEADARGLPLVEGRLGFDLQAKAQEAASLLKALANPDRLLLLCQMVDAERSGAELGDPGGIENGKGYRKPLSLRSGCRGFPRILSLREDGVERGGVTPLVGDHLPKRGTEVEGAPKSWKTLEESADFRVSYRPELPAST